MRYLLAILLVGLGLALTQSTTIGTNQIRNGAVTLPKLATQANNTALCNVSGSTASPTACTSANLKTLLALAVADVSGLQAALDGKLNLSGGTVSGTLTLNNGANSLKLTAGSVDHTYVEFYARTASPTTQSGYFGFPGAGSNDLYFANSISGGNIVLNTTGGGKLYSNGNTLIDSSDQRILYYGGLLASRPAAAAANSGLWYFASDVGGGTLYRSTGSTWQQVAAGLGNFTSSAAGLVPASGGGTTNFLRADGSWAAPVGGGGGITSLTKAALPTATSGNKGTVYFISDIKTGLGALGYSDGANWQFMDVGNIYPDSYASLQAAVTAAQTNKLRLVITPGTYTLSTALSIGDNADITCEQGATLQPGTASNTVLSIQANYLSLQGCRVDTTNQATYTGIAVDVLGTTNMYDRFGFTVSDLYINANFNYSGTCLRLFSAGAGASVRHISQTRWSNITCRGFQNGLLLQTTGGIANDYVNGNLFSGYYATTNTNQIKIDARTDAEVSRNQFQNFNLQTGTSTARSITISGKAIANEFSGTTWDWISGIAYEITGSGSSYTEPVFNRIEDYGFGNSISNLSIADNNYFVSIGSTRNPVENQPILPGSDNNRNFTGDQDDILAGATYRYTVTQIAGPAPSCRSGNLSDLFGPHGKCTWAVTAGQNVQIRVDLNPDGKGYDYISTIGAQYINSGEKPTSVSIQTGDTAPALSTQYSTTANNAMYTLWQSLGIGGTVQVRYIDYTFSRATAGNLSVQRLFSQGLIRNGPFWPQGSSGQLLYNLGGQLNGAVPAGTAGQILTSSGAGNPPTWLSSADIGRDLPTLSWDFTTTNTAAGPFTGAAISSGTNSTAPASGVVTTNHPGVVLARSSTTANSGYSYLTAATAFQLGGGQQFDAVIWLPAALTNNTIRLGFLDTTTSADAVDGAYIEIPTTGAAVCKTSNNSTRTTSATIATLSVSTWYHLRVVVTSTTSATCTIWSDAGTQLGTQTNTTNIPSTNGRETGAGIVGTNSGTVASDVYAIDLMQVAFNTARVRGQ